MYDDEVRRGDGAEQEHAGAMPEVLEKAVRAAFADMLQAHRRLVAALAAANRRAVFDAMDAMGIERAVVSYEASGTGETALAATFLGSDIPPGPATNLVRHRMPDMAEGRRPAIKDDTVPLKDALAFTAASLLAGDGSAASEGCDASGTLTFEAATRKVRQVHERRVTTAERTERTL